MLSHFNNTLSAPAYVPGAMFGGFTSIFFSCFSPQSDASFSSTARLIMHSNATASNS